MIDTLFYIDQLKQFFGVFFGETYNYAINGQFKICPRDLLTCAVEKCLIHFLFA